ncbi:MAG: efflux RND transporter periplasmic adaptor subunit [Myxococcales bacterium]|nr:efflux RND transporter periplasmic adaptor subunit [Myxococcales bacterium]
MKNIDLRILLSPALSAAVTLALGLVVGVWMASPPVDSAKRPAATGAAAAHQHGASSAATGGAAEAESASKTLWTCSMHPQIKLPEAGLCPICNMDLIPLKKKKGGGDGLRVEMSEAARAAARIETTVVKREAVTVPVPMVGKVAYDETRVARITAWFGGRIERAYVDFTGTRVRKGDHLVSIYSPELLVAQAELIQASKDAARAPAGPLGQAARTTKRAAKDKLRLWGLMDWQVRQIIRRGRPLKQVTIYAPMGGIVVHKNALEGAWVKTGTPLYTIADLSHVWVELNAYESDLAWLRYDQTTRFEVAAFPGEKFKGRIAFVNPTMDARTRTVKVRVDVANPDLRLKPEMFVRAHADVHVGAGQGPAANDLKGKFICPMHPSEVRPKAMRCSICGMKLVPAERHWLVGATTADGKREAPLVIPASAPLFTGKRVVVFVEQEGAKEPTYLVREVQLGARAGDKYLVRKGLMAGERVVSRGAFRLDSSMQIMGEPSIMNHQAGEETGAAAKPTQRQLAKEIVKHIRHIQFALKGKKLRSVADGVDALTEATAAYKGARGLQQAVRWLSASKSSLKAARTAFDDVWTIAARSVTGGDVLKAKKRAFDATFTNRFQQVLTHTLAISSALSADEPDKARKAAQRLVPAAKALVEGKRPVNPLLLSGAQALAAADATITAQRAAFEDINTALIPLTVVHADLLAGQFEQVYCPMAFGDKGAHWLQAPGKVHNPYYGAKMLRCGEKVTAVKADALEHLDQQPKVPASAGTAPEGTAPKGTAPKGTAPKATAPKGKADKPSAPHAGHNHGGH